MKKIVKFLRNKLFNSGRIVLVYAQKNNNTKTSSLLIGFYCLIFRLVHPLTLRLTEPGTAAVIKGILKKDMNFIDIGANKGLFTLQAAKIVGEKGKVVAFEPAPFNIKILKKILRRQNNVSIIPKAVSDVSGITRFFLSCSDSVTHTLLKSSKDESKFTEVETVSLDEFLDGRNYPIDVMKIDVEGAEIKVLEGMSRTIIKNPHLRILVEFHPEYIRAAGYDPAVFLDKLKELGFIVRIIDQADKTIKSLDHNLVEKLLLSKQRPILYCEIKPGISL
jgi:FkbM family methyltransferase